MKCNWNDKDGNKRRSRPTRGGWIEIRVPDAVDVREGVPPHPGRVD